MRKHPFLMKLIGVFLLLLVRTDRTYKREHKERCNSDAHLIHQLCEEHSTFASDARICGLTRFSRGFRAIIRLIHGTL